MDRRRIVAGGAMNEVDVDLQYDEAARLAQIWLTSRVSPPGEEDAEETLRLRDYLYSAWYSAAAEPKLATTDGLPFVQQLRVAHAGSRRWSDGWIAQRVSPLGRIVALRAGVHRPLAPGDYVNAASPGLLPVVGAPLLAVDRIDSTELLPGYWVTYSADWFPSAPVLFRVYWNIEPRGAAALTRAVSDLLPPHAYCLKVPTDPEGFRRTDAVVLYLQANVAEEVWARIRRVHRAVAWSLASGVPPLTRRLDRGLSIAQHDAASAESFGQHRCRLIAEAVRRSPGQGEPIVRAAIRRRLAGAGVDPDRPWTRAASESVEDHS